MAALLTLALESLVCSLVVVVTAGAPALFFRWLSVAVGR